MLFAVLTMRVFALIKASNCSAADDGREILVEL